MVADAEDAADQAPEGRGDEEDDLLLDDEDAEEADVGARRRGARGRRRRGGLVRGPRRRRRRRGVRRPPGSGRDGPGRPGEGGRRRLRSPPRPLESARGEPPTPAGWGHSSVGRALAWHARGQRFDPAWLHHPTPRRPLQSLRFGAERRACPLRPVGAVEADASEPLKGSSRLPSGPGARHEADVARSTPCRRRCFGRRHRCPGKLATRAARAPAGPSPASGMTPGNQAMARPTSVGPSTGLAPTSMTLTETATA